MPFMALAFVLTHWIFPVHEVYTSVKTGGEIDIVDGKLGDFAGSMYGDYAQIRFSTGGWPCSCFLKTESDGSPAITSILWMSLLANIVIWGAVSYLSWFYAKRPRSAQKESKSNWTVSLSDLLISTALLAVVLAYWQFLETRSRAEKSFAQDLVSKGALTYESLWLPFPLKMIVPSVLYPRLTRLTEVTLLNPDSSTLKKVLRLGCLMRLRIRGGEYDLGVLDQLQAHKLLVELVVSDRNLGPKSVISISKVMQLQSLNLRRTNVTANDLRQILLLPRLKTLELIRTDVKLSEIETVPISKTLQTLVLPHPLPGETDRLKLEGWPELRKVVCNEYDVELNATPVMLELRKLPKLSHVIIDSLQLFDLQLDELPELRSIEGISSQWQARVPSSRTIPNGPWIRNLQIGNVPKIRSIYLNAHLLDAVSFSHESKVALVINFHTYSSSTFFPSNSPTKVVDAKWLVGIGGSKGPETLTISGADLTDLNLTTLSNNKHTRKIELQGSAVTPAQLMELSGMQGIQELLLDEVALNGTELERLVSVLPNLRRIQCSTTNALGQLRLENKPNLESVLQPQLVPQRVPVFSLRLVNLPKLVDSFELPLRLKELCIEDCPALLGLIFHQTLPNNSVIKGLHNLEYFAAGGKGMNDHLFEAVMHCPYLDKLTLAYSDVSSEMLGKIGELNKLRHLVLAGSRVDDASVSRWSELRKLQTLRLDGTAITDAAMETISSFVNLRNLNLNRTSVTTRGLMLLAKLKRLENLTVDGSAVTKEWMQSVCEMNALTTLDISNGQLSADLIEPLIKLFPVSLRKLILRHSKVDGPATIMLAKQYPLLLFDLSGAEVDAATLKYLASTNQLSQIDDRLAAISLDALKNDSLRRVQIEFEIIGLDPATTSAQGEISPELFAPK